MKGKTVSMTGAEIMAKHGDDSAKTRAMLDAAPEFTPEELGMKPGKVVARGFSAFKECINRNSQPKAEDPKVSISIRIPLSAAAELQSTGKGWQTRASEYLTQGIRKGKVGKTATAAQ